MDNTANASLGAEAAKVTPLAQWRRSLGNASALAKLHHLRRATNPRSKPQDRALDALLLARGAAGWADISTARDAAEAGNLWIGHVLLARQTVSEPEILSALAEIYGLALADDSPLSNDPMLAACLTPKDALHLDAVPIARTGPVVVVATQRPDQAEAIHAALHLSPDHRAVLVLASQARILRAQIALYGEVLARLAEGQAPLSASCRGWRAHIATRGVAFGLLTLTALSIAQPIVMVAGAFAFALLIFVGNMALKILAFAATLRAEHRNTQSLTPARTSPDQPTDLPTDLPIVSILVPLYQEREIATTLMRWLARLDYPPERLDVLLVIEQDDGLTRAALSSMPLPGWARIITIPEGSPRTKPRALNFALNFARGTIIGIYDAEDRPESDQIFRVVQRFAQLGPDTACLQGQLDYHNARHNLLSRLFAIEYAIWFRVLLPGVQRLGLVVPLGGTTLFLRRAALADVGGWDAHNVTEDAELGLRLARHGYRTEILDTTTFEEANAAVFPWIRQRARWQKGYLLTWAIAMRRPVMLWRDLGMGRFLALQVQFFCAVSGFLIAPLLWSLMIKPFGFAHPLDAVVTPFGYGVLATMFVASVVLSMSLALYATRARHLRRLRLYIPLSELYFLLGTLSAWRATAEMLLRPFFWAKTRHGDFGGLTTEEMAPPSPEPSPPPP